MARALFACGLGLALAAGCQKATDTQPIAEPAPAPAADPMASVTIETTPVAGPVFLLVGAGGNIGVSAGDDGVVLIDDQFAPLAPKILAAVRALGHGDPEFVINTHFHGDHTGSNPILGESASIIAHENVRKRLASGRKVAGKVVEPMAPPGLPVVTFAESVSLHMNGEEIRVDHLPRGHTDGDSVVFFTGSNVVHMGDHFFNGAFPFIDVAGGGDVLQYERNVAAVLEKVGDDTKIIPGHGPLAGRAELVAFHDMLVETIGIVEKAKRAGKSLAAVQKAGLPAKYDALGKGFITTDAWIEAIYASVK